MIGRSPSAQPKPTSIPYLAPAEVAFDFSMDFSKLHVPALRALCVERGLRSVGIKRLLISRLSDPHFVEPAKPKLVKKALVVRKSSKATTGKRLRDGARPVQLVTETVALTVAKLRPATVDDEDDDDDVDSVDGQSIGAGT